MGFMDTDYSELADLMGHQDVFFPQTNAQMRNQGPTCSIVLPLSICKKGYPFLQISKD